MNKYEKIKEIGTGSYSSVYKAKNKETGQIVAIKELKRGRKSEGFSTTSLREIQLLQELKHENIIEIIDILYDKNDFIENNSSVSIVFEYMPHDLSALIKNKEIMNSISLSQIKGYMKQILEAIQFLHQNNIIHRDIKTGNILITENNIIKLGDFGLSRKKDEIGIYTKNMVTLWYRSPELLLGEKRYGEEVDLWSVGCVFLELFMGYPVMKGTSEMEQLDQIWNYCGTPTQEDWPEFFKFNVYKTFETPSFKPRKIKQTFQMLNPQVVDLIDHFLQLNPKKRISARKALNHELFKITPLPLKPEEMKQFKGTIEVFYDRYAAERRRNRSNSRERENDKENKEHNKYNKRGGNYNNRERGRAHKNRYN